MSSCVIVFLDRLSGVTIMSFWFSNWGHFGGHHGHHGHHHSHGSWHTKSWGWNKYSWASKCKAPEPEEKSFEITAFSADALGGMIKCGSSFEMPTAADTTITVTDNDKQLSGDGYWCRDDQATDRSGQTAVIESANCEVGNGGQIYAETIHKLWGSDCKVYQLVEIEQEGTNDSYFTFKGAVPPAGVSLTVYGSCNTRGVNYDDLGAGEVAQPITFADSLPVGEFTFRVEDDFLYGDDVDAYTLTIEGSGDARFDGVEFTSAYCVAAYDLLETGAELATAPAIKATMVEATAANAAGVLDGVGINGKSAADNLDLVSWIMNEEFTFVDNGDGTGETYTDAEVQAAIWGLVDDATTTLGGGTRENAMEIIDLAIANGEGFEAQNGDIHTALIIPTADEAPENVQPFIIGIEYTDPCMMD